MGITKNIQAFLSLIIKKSDKSKIGRFLFEPVVNNVMDRVAETTHGGVRLKFSTPNNLCNNRVITFSTKEPETLEWIDNMTAGSILWDIGANVGLYSVYAAKKKQCLVWAFEPSVFNLELLSRNIFLNDLADLICTVPLPLTDKLGSSKMRLTSREWGGALSTFGQEFGWDGKAIRKVFEYQTIGVSMEDAVNLLAIPQPDYIKLDVDGLEHFILKGGFSVLQKVKQILIEVNDDFEEQADSCRTLLTQAGLTLRDKRHSEMIENNTHGFQNSYNQIWVRQ